MTDEEFLAAFEDCRIPREDWTHEAHVRMAWLYLGRRPLDEVIPIVRAGIRRYNDAVIRKPDAYHETITLAMLALIDSERESGGRWETYAEFRERAPELLDRALPALLRHYRRETLFSDRARLTFVEPDLIPLSARKVGRGG
ncbi:hypothetical protein P12x_002230 [Tundrisphaera lichenicola]|uniref:hypothetical protein n=1 Tax=Tundrisphaera lichenicola TaxID=2029860 RepID=UPI003EB710F0